MYCTKSGFLKIVLILSFALVTGCAQKQAKAPVLSEQEQARIAQLETEEAQAQQDFAQALKRIQGESVSKEDLLLAQTEFDALYQRNNKYMGALINAADLAVRLEQFEAAQKRYLQVINNPPLKTDAALEGTENKESAESAESSSKSLSQFKLHAFNQLGLLARQAGDFDSAEAYYREALALNPEHPVSVKNLAILLDLYRGKLVDAYTLYEQYQQLVGDADPKIKDWLFDLKNRLPQEEAADSVEVKNE